MSFNTRNFKHIHGLWKSTYYGEGSFKKQGNNQITIRSSDWVYEFPSLKPSKNLVEARMKEYRLYKRFCRMVI